jgi:ubiquinone/menaquinone biosynthesis C-methylase UbiE
MPQSHYDNIAKHYEGVMRPLERWFLGRLRERALNNIPEQSLTLEVGAGTGLNFNYYSPAASGVASELSVEMLRIAAEKPRPEKVSLVRNDAEQLPFRDGAFDAVFSTLVLCSVSSPEKALAEMRRVVRPGGIVVLLEHVRPTGPLGVFFDVLNLVTVPLFCDHVNRRTADLAKVAGFKSVNENRSHLGIFNLIRCSN